MTGKSDDAFRTISEVSKMLDIPAHVLRFWETKFSSLRPLKRSGGRRYYRPTDVALLERIRDLLYKDGFTIKGAQKFLRSKTESPHDLDSLVSQAGGVVTDTENATETATATETGKDAHVALVAALALLQDARSDIARLKLAIAF
ncbi:MerR family transcriptional regulator [Candidatus Puniceispirillum sp.]|uniref:MerR family transcriptional regulator n=1 Tax=Candidatus Puniceispirillum sp. TaxID=2026719 RepID=UPI003F6A4AEA